MKQLNNRVTGSGIVDGSIADADVAVNAAIAGTKISPNFGGQTVQTTGVFSHALGTAGAPTITFTGDTDTGFYSPGANQLALSTNSTGRLFVDATGRVGVATASPYRTQTIRGTGEILQFDLNTTTNGSYASIAWNGGGVDLGASAQSAEIRGYREGGTAWGALAFHTRDASGTSLERVRIDSSGRLLVGTSADSGGALLQVNGDRIRVGNARTPASATATGSAGEICWDANYIYVCIATNTWKRADIATW